MSLISNPLFKTNGKEELATGDVYNLTNSAPVNKIFEAAKNVGKNLFDIAGGRQGLVNTATSLIQMKQQGASGKELLANALSGWGINKQSVLSQYGGPIMDSAGEYMGVKPEVMDKIKVTVDGTVRVMDGGDKGYALQQLLGLAGGLTNDPNLLRAIDIGSEAAVWGATISKAVEYNFPEMIKTVNAAVDPTVARWAMIYASDSVMGQGNLESHIAMMTVLTPDEVLGQNPEYIRVFLSAFKITESWTAAQYADKAALLLSTMKALDPNWYTFKRPVDPAPIIRLNALSGMSTDGKKILSYITELKEPIQMAGDFPLTTTYILCRDQYPLSVASLK